MGLQSLIVVDKISGIPLFSHDFQKISDNDETEKILISGVLSAIQALMAELSLGELNVVRTEKYQLIGYESPRYKYFLIGDFENLEMIYAMIQEFASFFEKVQLETGLPGIVDEVKSIARQKILFLQSIYDKSKFNVSIFNYSQQFGISEISQEHNIIVDSYLASYMASLSKTEISTDHSFYSILINNGHLLGLIFNDTDDLSDDISILCLYFEKSELSKIISYKHYFINMGYELLLGSINVIVDNSIDASIKETIIQSFIRDLDQKFVNYVPNEELMGSETLFEVFKEQIADIVSTALLGKPIAIAADEISAKYIIDFIVYITSLSDASIEQELQFPRRFIWCPPGFEEKYSSMGYTIIDLENILLVGELKSDYMTSFYKGIENDANIQQIMQIRDKSIYLIETAESIFKRIGKGAKFDKILNYLENDEREFILEMINWLKPELLGHRITEVKDKTIHW